MTKIRWDGATLIAIARAAMEAAVPAAEIMSGGFLPTLSKMNSAAIVPNKLTTPIVTFARRAPVVSWLETCSVRMTEP